MSEVNGSDWRSQYHAIMETTNLGAVVKSPKTWGTVIGAVALGALTGVVLFVGQKAPQLKALSKVPTYGKVLTTVGAVALGGAVGFGVTYLGKKGKDPLSGPSGPLATVHDRYPGAGDEGHGRW